MNALMFGLVLGTGFIIGWLARIYGEIRERDAKSIREEDDAYQNELPMDQEDFY